MSIRTGKKQKVTLVRIAEVKCRANANTHIDARDPSNLNGSGRGEDNENYGREHRAQAFFYPIFFVPVFFFITTTLMSAGISSVFCHVPIQQD